ncbi:MAG: AAA family ATPase, partial [Planctomycetota bacterium]
MNAEPSRQRKFPAQPLKSIKLQNILSFGPEGMELELKPLNVLIGANASGKSNFIDAIRLLQATPVSVQRFFADNEERAADWIHKGADATPGYVKLTFSHPAHAQPLTYTLSLGG